MVAVAGQRRGVVRGPRRTAPLRGGVAEQAPGPDLLEQPVARRPRRQPAEFLDLPEVRPQDVRTSGSASASAMTSPKSSRMVAPGMLPSGNVTAPRRAARTCSIAANGLSPARRRSGASAAIAATRSSKPPARSTVPVAVTGSRASAAAPGRGGRAGSCPRSRCGTRPLLQQRHHLVDERVEAGGGDVRDEDEAVAGVGLDEARRSCAATVAGEPTNDCRAVTSMTSSADRQFFGRGQLAPLAGGGQRVAVACRTLARPLRDRCCLADLGVEVGQRAVRVVAGQVAVPDAAPGT